MGSFFAVAPTFWDDLKVRGLPEDGRTLALYLLTCPEQSTEGFYRLPAVAAARHLQWEPTRVLDAFRELGAVDFARYDEHAEAVLVIKALKYRRPANANVVKAAVQRLDRVQDAPELFARFLRQADKYAPTLADAIRDRYDLEPLHDLASGSGNR